MRSIIIGGGINGILTSYYLSKRSDVILIEKNKDLLSEASAINASLLMFKPNFNIYSFVPQYNNIYNSLLISPKWCINYLYNYPFQNKINQKQEKLSDLSYKEAIKNFNIPLYRNVFEDNKRLNDVYILNCRNFGLNLVKNQLQNKVKIVTNKAVINFKYTSDNKIKSVILSDGSELETDLVVICTSYSEKFPILKVYGRAVIDYKPNNNRKIKSEIDHETDMVVTFDDVSQRYCKGTIVSLNKPNNLENTHFRSVTPDGLPIIDQDKEYNNLYYNIGHGFFGWTWSFGSAKLVEGLIFNDLTEYEREILKDVSKNRFW